MKKQEYKNFNGSRSNKNNFTKNGCNNFSNNNFLRNKDHHFDNKNNNLPRDTNNNDI